MLAFHVVINIMLMGILVNTLPNRNVFSGNLVPVRDDNPDLEAQE
jgi:hypothetical protein